jgi:hypothetical protein
VSVILLPDKWRRQPGALVEPEDYCTFAYNPAYSGPGLKACRGIPGAFIGSASAYNRAVANYGGMLALNTQHFYGGDGGVGFAGAGGLLSSARGWLLIYGSLITNQSANYQRLVYTTTGLTISKDGASIARVAIGGSEWNASVSWGDILNGKPTVLSWGPDGRAIWNGGRLLASTASAPGATAISGTLSLCDNDNQQIKHFLLAGGVHAPVTPAELSANPWQIFRKQPRILYFTAPSGGGATITGTFSGTDSVDTTSFAGDVLIQGTLAATDATDTTSFSGAVPISGTFSPTESAVDSAAFSGSVATAGIPTLSSPTVVSVTATTAVPRVTVTFA